MDDERPPALWRGMWARFLIAALLIMTLSGAATATVTLNKASEVANELFPELQRIKTPKGLVTQAYGGGPETFLILGSDRRAGSKNVTEKDAAPHSDTILLVRFDPSQGQTSVLSIPRDLMVNIRTPEGALYPKAKINAAYTIGSELKGTDGGIVLAAETIEREVFPDLKLNGIVDVNFAGFIKVVDTLGCAYVNVDHRYFGGGAAGEDFSSINLQPGYQKLCYENALDYVRYRHTDSDFVRVARQQDFLRELREQINPGDVLGQLETVAKAVGHAITTTFPASASELIELAKLVAFSEARPVRQVKFKASSEEAIINGGDYVTSTPELERQTLQEFLDEGGRSQPAVAAAAPRRASHEPRPAPVAGLAPTGQAGQAEVVRAALSTPFHVLYPALQTAQAEQQQTRAYDLRDEQGALHQAYVIVWQQSRVGGYYDLEGTNWLDPPIFKNASEQEIDGRQFKIVYDGSNIHVIGWIERGTLYWLNNTLLEELTNGQMIEIAKSARPLR